MTDPLSMPYDKLTESSNKNKTKKKNQKKKQKKAELKKKLHEDKRPLDELVQFITADEHGTTNSNKAHHKKKASKSKKKDNSKPKSKKKTAILQNNTSVTYHSSSESSNDESLDQEDTESYNSQLYYSDEEEQFSSEKSFDYNSLMSHIKTSIQSDDLPIKGNSIPTGIDMSLTPPNTVNNHEEQALLQSDNSQHITSEKHISPADDNKEQAILTSTNSKEKEILIPIYSKAEETFSTINSKTNATDSEENIFLQSKDKIEDDSVAKQYSFEEQEIISYNNEMQSILQERIEKLEKAIRESNEVNHSRIDALQQKVDTLEKIVIQQAQQMNNINRVVTDLYTFVTNHHRQEYNYKHSSHPVQHNVFSSIFSDNSHKIGSMHVAASQPQPQQKLFEMFPPVNPASNLHHSPTSPLSPADIFNGMSPRRNPSPSLFSTGHLPSTASGFR